jgi:hypothetical protein
MASQAGVFLKQLDQALYRLFGTLKVFPLLFGRVT